VNRRPAAIAVPVAVGWTAAAWTATPAANSVSVVLALIAAVAVVVAGWWHRAATVAGCLIVGAAAAGRIGAPHGAQPINGGVDSAVDIAVTAALLTGYLVLADQPTLTRPPAARVGAVAAAIAVTVAASYLQGPAWYVLVGLAAGGAAYLLAAGVVRGVIAAGSPRRDGLTAPPASGAS
jgi:hypothetical protein